MKSTDLHIARTVQLKEGTIHCNGEELYPAPSVSEQADWFKQMYRSMEMAYPKFHKMDALSKLAVLMAEVLFQKSDDIEDVRKNTGVLIFNKNSSIDADVAHQQLIQDRENALPSPAIFVYTLPNIMLGEICIRHKINGENLCLIAPAFDPELAIQQCEMLMAAGMEQLVVGWVDTFDGTAKAWMALVQKDGNAPNISQLSAEFLSELDNIPTWKH